MNFQILKETTKWDGDVAIPNHTYVLNRASKCIAYAPLHGELITLNTPVNFTKTRRKFETKKVKDYTKYFK